MNEIISSFLLNQSVVTICCVDESGKPYCFPVFFAFNCKQGIIYFKSSTQAYHTTLLARNPAVTGTVLPDKLNIMAMKGVQFEGTVLPKGDILLKNASKYYYNKFPLALIIPGDIYAIMLTDIKMTDGAKGFGKKIRWNREEVYQ